MRSFARDLAFRPVRSLPDSPDTRWSMLDIKEMQPYTARWTDVFHEWRMSLTALLDRPMEENPQPGTLDLLLVWSTMHFEKHSPLVKAGRHIIMPAPLQWLVLWPEARLRERLRFHTLIVRDHEHALGWATRGRSAIDPRLFYVDAA